MHRWNRKLVDAWALSFVLLVSAWAQSDLLRQFASGDEEERKSAAVQAAVVLQSAVDAERTSLLATVRRALQSDSSPVVRALAARALELNADPEAGPVLLAALAPERDIAARKAILYALARYPSAPLTVTLLPLLNDKQQEIRGAAAYALAEAGDAQAAQALLQFLTRRTKDEDQFGRAQAARGLGRIGNSAAFAALLRALERDNFPEVRREAARALGRLATRQDVKAVEALSAARLAADPYLVEVAEAALAEIERREQESGLKP